MSTPLPPSTPPRPSAGLRTCRLPIVPLATAVGCMAGFSAIQAQTREPGFTIEEILSPPFRYGLVAAKDADRVAWIENERGMRNVYTAAAPDFTPVRLTANLDDDAIDLTSLRISDDGSVVVFMRGHTPNFKGQIGNQGSHPEGGRREVWAVGTSGNRRPWRVVAARDAHLSPDGEWVLHVVDDQIHRAAVDPGNTDPASLDAAPPLFVTLGENGSPVWSPDGRKIAFVTARYDQRQYFPTQGHVTTHSFVGVYDVDSRRISYMAPSVDRDTSPVWSPDGRQIAFIRRPGLPFGHFASAPRDLPREQIPPGFLEARFQGGYTLGIWVVDVATGKGREVWHNQPGDARFAQINALRWAGDHVLFQAEPENWRHWFSVSVPDAGPDPVLLTPGEGEVEDVTVSPDGRWLYYTSNIGDLDRRNVWRVPVAGGRAEQLTRAPTIETAPVMLGSGQHLAVIQSGPAQPVAVAILPTGGGQPRVISSAPAAGFPAERHVVPRVEVITAADGVDAHSMVFLPPDLRAGERRPALLYIHGGGGRSVLGYPDQAPHGFYHMSYGVIQYFVNKGYIVAAVNYRGGSALYGRAFRNPPETRDQGNSEYRDVLAAGLWLRDRPDVDPERLGVWGLSYGGWLTGQALSRNSDVFKAGMIFAGVQLRSTSLDPDDLAYRSSPAYNIGKWTSPVLVIHGDDDRNVEFSQTIGLVQLLRAHEIPHEVIVYPDDTHYFGLFSRWLEAFDAVDDFFERALIRKDLSRVTDSDR